MISDKCKETTIAMGDSIIIQGAKVEQRYFCSIDGRVFKDNAGNDIQESVKCWEYVQVFYL